MAIEQVTQTMESTFADSFLPPEAVAATDKIVVPTDRLEARRLLHEQCPKSPGVYGWFDPCGQLGYVGKSKSLKHRLLSYFSKTVPDEKMNRIRRNSRMICWQPVSDELLALLREQELINRWRPAYNSQGQPTRRKPAFISISTANAPNVLVQRQLNPRAIHRFGPIMGTAQLREAIDNVNNLFGLRDCPDRTTIQFSDQLELFADDRAAKCIRHELATCPAPCASACSRIEYMQSVDRAVAFLSGYDRNVLDNLKSRMEQAARQQQYEIAAIFRNRWESLAWLDRRLESLRKARLELNCIYVLPGFRDSTIWLMLDGGFPTACCAAPESASAARAVEAELKLLGSEDQRFPSGPLETNLQLITLSWFRQHRDEKANLESVASGLKHCRALIDAKVRKSA